MPLISALLVVQNRSMFDVRGQGDPRMMLPMLWKAKLKRRHGNELIIQSSVGLVAG